MLAIFEAILAATCLVVSVPSIVLFAEAVSALRGQGRIPGTIGPMRHGPVAVLVPAHNEGQGLGATLANVARQLRPEDRIWVVADNCTDNTAEVAAAHGATVLVRDDALRRGKGYALDFGLKALRSQAPQVVAVIDADCRLTDGSLQKLAAHCSETGRPVQSLNLMKAPAGQHARFAVAEFAWILRNQVRPLGLARLGLPCQLMGTGMAFPWAVIGTVDLASGNIVEDLELGVKLARAGTPPKFFPGACVLSEFPATEEGIVKQRQRWEQGSLAMLLGSSLRTAIDAVSRLDKALFAMALDMMVPPLTLHGAIAVLLLVLCAPAYWLGLTSPWPIALAAGAGALFASAILLSWFAFGRHVLPLSLWPRLLQFVLVKLKIYRGFSVKGKRDWVRTDRSKDH